MDELQVTTIPDHPQVYNQINPSCLTLISQSIFTHPNFKALGRSFKITPGEQGINKRREHHVVLQPANCFKLAVVVPRPRIQQYPINSS